MIVRIGCLFLPVINRFAQRLQLIGRGNGFSKAEAARGAEEVPKVDM